jgi:peptidoglycan/LPS O-acetylase OafA/YrhL
LAEKGQPVPVELFNGPRRAAPVGMMRGGIILVAIGIALMTFFWSMTAQSWFHGPIEDVSWLPTLGFFPFMIGVALLIMAAFERNRPA